MMLLRVLIVFPSLTTLAVLPTPAIAWSEMGNLTVCDLAYRNLTDTTRDKLIKLLKSKTGGITIKSRSGFIKRKYTSFNYGCLEEDSRPRKHPKDHFINVPRTTKTIKNNQCPGNISCILAGITRDVAILKDTTKSDEDRVFALMAIGHWVGDIHQPLHVSFKDDLGGNQIKVKLKGKSGSASDKPTKLHAVWDDCLLQAGLFEEVRQGRKYKPTWKRTSISCEAASMLQSETSHSEELTMVGTNPWKWARESYKIAVRPTVQYCTKLGQLCQYDGTRKRLKKNGKPRKLELSQDYLQKFKDIAKERVRLAGFRLAHLINLALDPQYTRPVQNSAQNPYARP